MRSHFNCGPNYKHLSYSSHTISLLLQVSLLVCASPYLVCLRVAYAMRQTHTHTHSQAASKHSNEQLLCFVFSSADPLQMTSPYRAGEKQVGFVCILQYRVYGERWGGGMVEGLGFGTHVEEPNLRWVRAEEPKKTLDLQNKTLSMEMDIFTCMAPWRTTAEWLFNGKQSDCVRPAKGSPWETSNLRLNENSQILEGCSINTKTQVWI